MNGHGYGDIGGRAPQRADRHNFLTARGDAHPTS